MAQNENLSFAPIVAAAAIPRWVGQPTPLIIVVSPPPAQHGSRLDPVTYVLLSHLPAQTRLSQGLDLGNGTWRVSLDELAELTVTIPADYGGTTTLSVTAISDYGEGRVTRDTKKVEIPVRSSDEAATTATNDSARSVPAEVLALRSVPPPAPTQPEAKPVMAAPGPGLAPVPKPNAVSGQKLMKRGDELFAQGDLAGARLFYERAASSGSGPAALAVGKTYDPLVHERLHVRGFSADPDQAAAWYRRAMANGSGEAEGQLKELSAWIARKTK